MCIRDRLYTPDDSPSFDAKAKVEASFSFPAREGYVYAVRRPGVTDLLSTQSVLDWHDTWSALQSVKALGDGPDTAETLATVCVLKAGACRASSVLAVWNYNRTLIASRTDAQIKPARMASPPSRTALRSASTGSSISTPPARPPASSWCWCSRWTSKISRAGRAMIRRPWPGRKMPTT